MLLLRAKNRELYERALEILQAEHPVTLRQLFYRLVSVGVLRNAQAEYQRLGALMTRAREAGKIARSWIVDHVRATLKPSSWSGLGDFADTVPEAYRNDFWASLDDHVELFVEKDAVAGTIQPVTNEYDVALRVCRGYASVSFAGEIADEWSRIEKPIFAYYCGDFDPSGFDIERDLRAKLERYSGRAHERDENWADETNFVWKRLGIVDDDFAEFDLIELPVKPKDKRAAGFLDRHGNRCAEIDALSPSELRRRVKAAVTNHIDAARWNALLETESHERESVRNAIIDLGVQ